jgi:two-component system OmpR family sensor kinase
MSLRARVVFGCLVVAAVLLLSDIVLASTFRTFLMDRVDRQLAAAGAPLARTAEPSTRGPDEHHADSPPSPATFSEYYVEERDASGAVRWQRKPGYDSGAAPTITAQQISTHMSSSGAASAFTASASGGRTYRAIAYPSRDGGSVIVALDLGPSDATFNRMVVIESVATLSVLAALAAVAVWVLRLGIRPLAAMARTADDIARGDLTRRVDHDDDRTEAGKLGVAFNTMVGQIEEAFNARAASEDRLRRFVADASHELRTPLTSIRGYAELWRQGGLRARGELAEAMRRMEQEAARMGVLVDDMLLLARLDQRRPLERMPVDVVNVVEDAVRDAQAVEPDRPIDLVVDPAGGERAVVEGDEYRIRQVFANLLGNARVHTPAGTPVHVRLAVDAATRTVRVSVADEGPGLPAGTATKVFERFYRSDSSRTRASGGSGLGLSIVSALADAHGGRAWADDPTASGASSGARFNVELPLSSEPSPVERPPETRRRRQAVGDPRQG